MSAERLPLTEDELVWPTDDEVRRALDIFADAVRKHYGAELAGLYLFGSRSRGDHRPSSDADVAVVLTDGDWVDWQERRVLSRLAYVPSLDFGVLIQPWPVPASEWGATAATVKAFVRSAFQDARPIGPI